MVFGVKLAWRALPEAADLAMPKLVLTCMVTPRESPIREDEGETNNDET